MEPSAEEQVLVNIPETLDAIFQFLDPKNLVKCRTVCRRWRAISNIQMKRRLATRYFDSLNAYNGTMKIDTKAYYELHEVRLIGFKENSKDKLLSSSTMADEKAKNDVAAKCQKPDETEMQCLVIQDSSSPAAVVVETKRKLSWRKVKPMPWFVSTVLQVDWLPSVGKLVLDRCLTVDDWNAAANAILAKFPVLVELQLWLPQDRSSVLPLVYADLMEEAKVELPSLKKVLIQYYFNCFNWTQQSQHRQPPKEPEQGGFQLENVEWTSGVNWEFLKQCTSLQTVFGWIYFGTPNRWGNVFHAEITAWRSTLENNVQEKYSPWKLQVLNKADQFWLREIETDFYNSAFAQDIANLINTLQPAKLCIPLEPKLHSSLASSKNTTNIQKLEFSEDGFHDLLRTPFKASTIYIASAFKLAASFDNIQRLDFPYFCKPPLNFEDLTPLDPSRSAKNLVTLIIRSSNDWMQQNLSQLMPNVQLLVFRYTPNAACDDSSKLPKVLTLCSSFRKLKHLVILIIESFTQTEIRAFGVELAEHLTRYVNGLESLTVLAFLKSEEDLELLTKQCLSICAPAESIRKLGVFSKKKSETEELDVSKLGLSIPDHLAVRAGHVTLLEDREAEFDGMDHSHVTWNELLDLHSYT